MRLGGGKRLTVAVAWPMVAAATRTAVVFIVFGVVGCRYENRTLENSVTTIYAEEVKNVRENRDVKQV